MNTSKSSENSILVKYLDEIVAMINEVDDWKKDLWALNDHLLESSHHMCSEYGDRMLENKQSKLFHFQHVLKICKNALTEYKEKLKDASKSDENQLSKFKEYQQFCYDTAKKVSGKLEKYKIETAAFLDKNCSTD